MAAVRGVKTYDQYILLMTVIQVQPVGCTCHSPRDFIVYYTFHDDKILSQYLIEGSQNNH
jgi:hypothetical protein